MHLLDIISLVELRDFLLRFLLKLTEALVALIIFGIIVWLILPYIFRFFVAPSFDGTYKYEKGDFKTNSVEEIDINKLLKQKMAYKIEFDKASGLFNLTLTGEKESLGNFINLGPFLSMGNNLYIPEALFDNNNNKKLINFKALKKSLGGIYNFKNILPLRVVNKETLSLPEIKEKMDNDPDFRDFMGGFISIIDDLMETNNKNDNNNYNGLVHAYITYWGSEHHDREYLFRTVVISFKNIKLLVKRTDIIFERTYSGNNKVSAKSETGKNIEGLTQNNEISVDFIEFGIIFPEDLNFHENNIATVGKDSKNAEFGAPNIMFPVFMNDSSLRRMFSYKPGIFSPPARKIDHTFGPVILFNDDLNACIFSSLDNFLVNIFKFIDAKNIIIKSKSKDRSMQYYNGGTELFGHGLNGEVLSVSEGYVNKSILLINNGINNSFEALGDLTRKYHNLDRKRIYSDTFNSYLGYWTDNGAYYYYNPMKNKTMAETLLEVDKVLKELDVPIKYYNLDSWWYIKEVSSFKRKLLGNLGRLLGGGLYGGTLRWEPDPETMNILPERLSELMDGKPFNAHNRWFSAQTPYREKFNFNVEGKRAISTDPAFWDMMMQNCKKWNILNYEQDWMHNQFKSFRPLRDNVDTAQKWLKTMATSAKKYDLTIEYCMSNPGIFLESLKYDNVTFIRASGDYHPRWPRIYDFRFFVQVSILANMVNTWPFKDVFRSVCEGPINGEKQPELMALLSTLSCGPVGIGDRVDQTKYIGTEILKRVCRKDGLILKPNKPITASDRMFLPHRKYFISSTYSQIPLTIIGEDARKNSNIADMQMGSNNLYYTNYYILVNKLKIRPAQDNILYIKDLDLSLINKDNNNETLGNDIIAYNYFKGTFQVFSQDNPLRFRFKKQEYAFIILSTPLLKKGLFLIGDISKFTTLSFRAFLNIRFHPNSTNSTNSIELEMEGVKSDLAYLLFYDQDVIKKIELEHIRLDDIHNDQEDNGADRCNLDAPTYETIDNPYLITKEPFSEELAWLKDNEKHISLLIFKYKTGFVKINLFL